MRPATVEPIVACCNSPTQAFVGRNNGTRFANIHGMEMLELGRDDTVEEAVACYRSGDLPEADRICRQLLDREPSNGDVLHLLGFMRLGAHDYRGARDFLEQAASSSPEDAVCHYNLGEARRSLGLLKEAAEAYGQAVELKPAFFEATNNLAIVLADLGLADRAIEAYERALDAAPDSKTTLMSLGALLTEAGRFREAVSCFERAISVDAGLLEAYDGLCCASSGFERPAEALSSFMESVEVRSDAPTVLGRLAEALQGLGRTDEALSVYERALLIDPRCVETHHAMGLLLENLGRVDEAYQSLGRAVHLDPDRAGVYDDLGLLCYRQGRFDEAKCFFRTAVDKKETFAAAHSHLAAVLAREGLLEAAATHYEKADTLDPRAGYKVIKATLVPVIPRSQEEIRSARVAMERHIDDLIEEGISVVDPFRDIGRAHFLLAYQGLDDRDIQVKLARFYESICPDLAFVAPHCKTKRGAKGARKIKIGFLSRHLKNHTVGQYLRGIIAHIDRTAFEVHLFLFPQKKDDITRFIEEQADSVTLMPETLFLARRAVAAKELDILLYPDIGMDPFTYFLAFSRLAPVQCAFYGHPITTGIRSVDYFISHVDCEVPGEGGSHYSERLVKLSQEVTYTYYYAPRRDACKKERAGFSLSESDHVYLCAQSLFKVHPDFDPMLEAILRDDEDGVILLFQGEHATWTAMLEERLKKRLGPDIGRVRFMARQPYEEYLRLVELSDVVLDTPHFNGGATTFDAFAVNTPVVTLPGTYLRGRQTYALYKRMGVMDCVAHSAQEYVDKAVRLGTDRSYREEIRQKIESKSPLIFDDKGMVRELERHLAAMVRETDPT